MLVIKFDIYFNNVHLAQSLESYTKNIFDSIMGKISKWYSVINQLPININIKVEGKYKKKVEYPI